MTAPLTYQQLLTMSDTPTARRMDALGRAPRDYYQELLDDEQSLIQSAQPNLLDPSAGQMRAHRAEMAKNLGRAGLTEAVSFALEAMPTAQDIENNRRVRELKKMRDEDRLGLSGGERRAATAERMNPVAALAAESRMRTEGAMAAAGGGMSAADITRAQREEQRLVAEQARRAGAEIDALDRQRAAEQLKELDSRIAYKGARQGQLLQSAVSRIDRVSQQAGRMAAGQVPEELDLGALQARYPDRWERVLEMLNKASPAQRKHLLQLMETGGPDHATPLGG